MTPADRQRTRIKICGITRAEDATAAAEAGVDAIGLVFWPGTPRVVTHAQARAIVAALPPFVGVVGLFVDPEPDAVRGALAAVSLDFLQFHGSEPAPFCRSFGRRYLKAIAVTEAVDLLEAATPYDDAAGILLDAYRKGDLPGGTGHSFDWQRVTEEVRVRLTGRLILSGGLDADNVSAAIESVAPWGVDVSSGVEERDAAGAPRRGLKEAARMRAFVQAVHAADTRSSAGR